ncbi:MAG: arylesterase [Gammaproteobacteria bacterium]
MSITGKALPFLHICLLLVGVLAGACSDQQAGFRLPDDAVLLAFGDSITYGSGAEEEQSYPAVLSRLSGHPVINAGIPGEISAAGKQRLPALLDRHKPALLILCHGGNDLLHRLDPVETRSNLEAMIESASQRNIPVLLIGVPEFALLFLDTSEMYNELAEKYALLYEGKVLPRVESDPGLKSDRIHPNAEGYREIAVAVHQLLINSGALDQGNP